VEVWVHAQLRHRFETTGRKDLRVDTRSELVSQRARLALGARFFSRYRVFLQLQDVRKWGEETSTLGDYDADGLDLHQGWAEVRIWRGLHLRLGRQEIAYDDHRLVGTVNWSQQGRSFDAARLWWQCKLLRAEAFYARLREKDGDDAVEADQHFWGLWVKLRSYEWAKPSLLFLSEIDWDEGARRHRETVGGRVHGAFGGLVYDVAFYYQVGRDDTTDQDLRAFLFAGKVGYRAPVATAPGLQLWAELLSGDDDPTDGPARTFDTLYATNHKFYGFMDFFLNIPAHTGGRGLQDFGGRAHLTPVKGLWMAVDYHLLRLMVADPTGAQLLGHELDLTVRYQILRWVSVQTGYSVLVPDTALANLKEGREQPEHWYYLQTNLSF